MSGWLDPPLVFDSVLVKKIKLNCFQHFICRRSLDVDYKNEYVSGIPERTKRGNQNEQETEGEVEHREKMQLIAIFDQL
jgi:hypothetical protein